MRYVMAFMAVLVAAAAAWLIAAGDRGTRPGARAGVPPAAVGTAMPFELTPDPPDITRATSREGLIASAKSWAEREGGPNTLVEGFERTTVRAFADAQGWAREEAEGFKRGANLTDDSALGVVRLRGIFTVPGRPGRPPDPPELSVMTVVFDGTTGIVLHTHHVYGERLPAGP